MPGFFIQQFAAALNGLRRGKLFVRVCEGSGVCVCLLGVLSLSVFVERFLCSSGTGTPRI